MNYISNIEMFTVYIVRNRGIIQDRSAFHDPVAFSLEWNGVRYALNRGYRQRELYREDGGVEFRHRLDEIFNGLLDEGFLIRAR